MKKLTFVVVVVSVVAVTLMLFFPRMHSSMSMTSQAIDTDKTSEAARQAVMHYVEAVKTGDVSNMMLYSKDIRYGNDESGRKAAYTQLAKHDQIQEIQINELKKVDDNLVIVSLESINNDGTMQLVSLPVYKVNGEWKVVVGGQTSAPMKTQR